MPFAKPDAEPVYLTQMKALLKRHPKTTIIWAHIGLGRIVHPVQVSAEAAERTPTQLEIVEAMLTDPAFSHVNFDISWDEVAKYAVAIAGVDRARGRRCSTGIRIASCSAPTPSRRPGRRRTSRSSTCGRRCGRRLTPEASLKVRKGNYERIFDEGRRRVRAWEAANVK